MESWKKFVRRSDSWREILVLAFISVAATSIVSVSRARAQTTDDLTEQCRHRVNFAAMQMAGHGEPQTDYCVALAFDRGDMGWPKDTARAVELLQSSARAGYAPAEFLLAEHYTKGLGVRQDFSRALALLRESAAQGLPGAENDLGAAYMYGLGVPKNNAEAIKWFRLAAAHGDAKAQNNLANLQNEIAHPPRVEPAQDLYNQGRQLYHSGQKEAAARPFLAAAEAGNSIAQVDTGWNYQHGVGLPRDPVKAAEWYRKAADLGNSTGMWDLGLLYEKGVGVPEDWVLAARWYQKSADLDSPIGERELAIAYQFGIGVPQNRQTALYWYRRAAASRDPQSAYWARWLADPTNDIGYRNQQEKDLYMRTHSRIRAYPGYLVVLRCPGPDEPVGVLFHNEPERLAWLGQCR